MSKQSGKPKKTKGLGAGIIAFGVTFVLISSIFRIHGLGGALLTLILSGLVGTVVRIMGSGLDLTTHNKQDATPDSLEKVAKDTGNPEVDALLQKGREMITEIRAENAKIPEAGLTEKLNQLETLCSDIFRAVYDKPAKASQIRKFMDYYLPTTLKMVKAYRTLGERNIDGQEVVAARKRIDDALGVVLKGCRKLLNNLYQDDVLDVTTDIDVLEQMLKYDGLTESDLQKAADQARQAAQVNAAVDQAQAARAAQTTAAPQAARQPVAAETVDPNAWQPTYQTTVAQDVARVREEAQQHVPQAPMLQLGDQAQATQKQD